MYQVPDDLLKNDTYTHYQTRYYNVSPSGASYVQLENQQPYNDALAARDKENGYPAKPTLDTTYQGFVKKYIKPETGAFKTQWVVDQDEEAAK